MAPRKFPRIIILHGDVHSECTTARYSSIDRDLMITAGLRWFSGRRLSFEEVQSCRAPSASAVFAVMMRT